MFRINASVNFEQVGVTVKVVKVFEKGKIEGVFDVDVRFSLCEEGSQVNGELFVRDGVFKGAFVNGFQAGEDLLLGLFTPSDHGELSSEVVVGSVSRKAVREFHRFEFRAVHKNNSCFSVRVCCGFVVGLWIKLFD